MGCNHRTQMASTGSRRAFTASALPSGLSLSTWLLRRGCDQRAINRIEARRFTYGSYRPADRVAFMLDADPALTPYASEAVVA